MATWLNNQRSIISNCPPSLLLPYFKHHNAYDISMLLSLILLLPFSTTLLTNNKGVVGAFLYPHTTTTCQTTYQKHPHWPHQHQNLNLSSLSKKQQTSKHYHSMSKRSVEDISTMEADNSSDVPKVATILIEGPWVVPADSVCLYCAVCLLLFC